MRGRRLILVVMCAGLFLVQLDVSIVNVALPSIRADLRASAAGLQWVNLGTLGCIYLLTLFLQVVQHRSALDAHERRFGDLGPH